MKYLSQTAKPRQAVTRRGRTQRRAQRGAALVEAAFMLPMFVILFYASIYAHNLGYAYMQENHLSRGYTWALAMNNCKAAPTGGTSIEVLPVAADWGNATPVSPGDNPKLPSASGSNFISGLYGDIAGALAKVFPDPESAQSTNTKTLNWRDPNLYVKTPEGSSTTKVTQTVTVYCNNAPSTGGVWNTVKYAVTSIL